ncbi:MAG: hypothetical protein JWQ54_1663 [Mucilaginibacter sp.]|nr:hypothetical protein [Mucilaginibacter sp.]
MRWLRSIQSAHYIAVIIGFKALTYCYIKYFHKTMRKRLISILNELFMLSDRINHTFLMIEIGTRFVWQFEVNPVQS